jgi:hypothetical protein
MEAIISIITIFGVLPISITGMVMYYRLKRIQLLEGSSTASLSQKEIEVIKALVKDNQELKKRMENMELIMHDSKLLSADDKK